MRKWLRSALVVIGLFSAILLALTAMLGRLEALIVEIAETWRRLKGSDSVTELARDIKDGVGIAAETSAIISWQAWLAVFFVLVTSTYVWHNLITRPRDREKARIKKRLQPKRKGTERRNSKAKNNDP